MHVLLCILLFLWLLMSVQIQANITIWLNIIQFCSFSHMSIRLDWWYIVKTNYTWAGFQSRKRSNPCLYCHIFVDISMLTASPGGNIKALCIYSVFYKFLWTLEIGNLINKFKCLTQRPPKANLKLKYHSTKKGNYHFTKRIIINDILKDSNNRMDQN